MKHSLIFLFSLLFTFRASSQEFEEAFNIMLNGYSHLTSFNFFTGKDAKQFRTTGKAFGSGIYDFSQQVGLNPWISNPEKHFIGLSVGLNVAMTKYRFETPWKFNECPLQYDTVSSHYYNASFLSRDGSKLVLFTLNAPIVITVPIGKWMEKNKIYAFAGAGYERYLGGKQKLRYSDDGQSIKEKYGNDVLKNMPLNKNNVIFTGGLAFTDFLLIRIDYHVYSLFSTGYDLHGISVSLSSLLDVNSDTKEIDYEKYDL